MALVFFPHFVNELGKVLRIGEAYNGAGCDSVSVAAADNGLIPFPGEFQDGVIFLTASQAAKFEGVHQVSELRHEIGECLDMLLPADSGEVPQRMIENDQDVGILIEGPKKIEQAFLRRVPGVAAQLNHDGFGAVCRQIVNAQVQVGIQVRDGPFDRDWDFSRFFDDAQRQRRVDTVVICQRNHPGNSETTLDLVPLETKRSQGRERRRPIGPGKVHGDGGFGLGPLFLGRQGKTP